MRTIWIAAAALTGFGVAAQTPEQADAIRAGVYQVHLDSNALFLQGDYDGAAALLRDALAAAPTRAEASLLNEHLASALMMAGDYETAQKHYRAVVQDPVGLDAERLDHVWGLLATVTQKMGDLEDVIRIVAQWQEHVDEPSAKAYKTLAVAHYELGNRTAALVEGERYAAMLREAGEPVPSNFARLLAYLRRPEGETSDFLTSELSDLASSETLALLVRANDMMAIQRYADAAELLSNALRESAANLDATDAALLREKLAWALAHGQDMDGAIEHFNAITQAPGDLPGEMLDKIWMRLAAANYKTGAYEAALRSAETWRARAGEPNALYFRLTAMCHSHLGDADAALTQGRRYIELARREGEEIPASFKALFGDALREELGTP